MSSIIRSSVSTHLRSHDRDSSRSSPSSDTGIVAGSDTLLATQFQFISLDCGHCDDAHMLRLNLLSFKHTQLFSQPICIFTCDSRWTCKDLQRNFWRLFKHYFLHGERSPSCDPTNGVDEINKINVNVQGMYTATCNSC